MFVGWKNQSRCLSACISTTGGPGRLRNGSIGWYEVDLVPWLLGWNLRVQASITKPGDGYGYPRPIPHEVPHRRAAVLFPSQTTDLARYVVEGDVVEIEYLIPDCISRFHDSPGWGCSAGGPIMRYDEMYHCQALLIAKKPDDQSELRREERELVFVMCTNTGQRVEVGRLADQRGG